MRLTDLLNVLQKFSGETEVEVPSMTVGGQEIVSRGNLTVEPIPGKGPLSLIALIRKPDTKKKRKAHA